MIVDVHTHIGQSLQGYAQSVDGLLASMDRLSIDHAVLCSVRPLDYAYPPENDAVAATVHDHPSRFWGFGRVDPRRPDAAQETSRCLDTLKLRGIYLHPWEDTFIISDPMSDPVMQVCQAHGAVVLIATGYPLVSEALQVAELARRFPDVTIIMTNGGQINVSGMGQRNAWLALEAHPNLYITTSGVYREDFIEEVITQIGAARVLFGSQAPLFDQDYELHRIHWAHISEPLRAQVIGENALQLLGKLPDQ